MLKGEAKRDYQREWVRQKRGSTLSKGSTVEVRHFTIAPDVRPVVRPSRDIKTKAYSKEEQLDVRMSKKQVEKRATFEGLKRKYDMREG